MIWGEKKINLKVIVTDSELLGSALLPETNSQGDHAILYTLNILFGKES